MHDGELVIELWSRICRYRLLEALVIYGYHLAIIYSMVHRRLGNWRPAGVLIRFWVFDELIV